MLPALAAVFTFLAIVALIVGVRRLFESRSEPESRVRALTRSEARVAAFRQPLLRRPPSSIPVLRAALSGVWGERLRFDLDRANLRLRPGEYVAIRLLLAVLFFLAGMIPLGGWPGLLLGILLGFLGFMLPALYVRRRIAKRSEATTGQLSEFLRLAANSMRAGSALLQALESAAKELPPPLSEEVERVLVDARLGAKTDDSLRALAKRVGSYEVQMMVTAILVQRGTGGNLADILEKVAETMEERERIRGDVRTFTAQQRLTGNILSVYPLLLALFFTALHPSLMAHLWTDPAGLVMLTIAAVLQVTGFFIIRRILAVDY
jgi:tight adherence protein B